MAILQADVTSNTVILSKSEQILSGEASFSLSNTSGRDLSVTVQILADKPKAMEWVSFSQNGSTGSKPLTRLDETFRIGETRQYLVKITVPASAEPGSYAIRIRAAEDSLPDENWAESPSVVFEVAPAQQPPKKAFPWWIIAVVLAVLLVVGGIVAFLLLRPKDGGEVTPTPTATPILTLTPTIEPSPTPTLEPTTVVGVGDITFATFPDGTPINADQILTGNEFAAAGITLSGRSSTDYCADATAAAIRRPAYNVPINFLTTASPGDVNRCNGIPVVITFNTPVRRVTLTFYGASSTYRLAAYDSSDTFLGSENQAAVYGAEDFLVTFQSDSANIKYVTFGYQASITAVTRIQFE